MPHFNRSFDLTISDIEVIESALRDKSRTLAETKLAGGADTAADPDAMSNLDNQARQVHDLWGRLHNQKVFYRPRTGTYVGG